MHVGWLVCERAVAEGWLKPKAGPDDACTHTPTRTCSTGRVPPLRPERLRPRAGAASRSSSYPSPSSAGISITTVLLPGGARSGVGERRPRPLRMRASVCGVGGASGAKLPATSPRPFAMRQACPTLRTPLHSHATHTPTHNHTCPCRPHRAPPPLPTRGCPPAPARPPAPHPPTPGRRLPSRPPHPPSPPCPRRPPPAPPRPPPPPETARTPRGARPPRHQALRREGECGWGGGGRGMWGGLGVGRRCQ